MWIGSNHFLCPSPWIVPLGAMCAQGGALEIWEAGNHSVIAHTLAGSPVAASNLGHAANNRAPAGAT